MSQKNKAQNRYQVGIIVGIVFMCIYGYATFNAMRMHKTSDKYWYLAITASWFLLSVYWLLQLGKLGKQQKDKED